MYHVPLLWLSSLILHILSHFVIEIFQLSCNMKKVNLLTGNHYGQYRVVNWSGERERERIIGCGYTNLVSLTRLQFTLQGSLATMGYMGLWL